MLILVFISPPPWDTPSILLQQFFQAPPVFIENICLCFWRHFQQLLHFLITGALLSLDCWFLPLPVQVQKSQSNMLEHCIQVQIWGFLQPGVHIEMKLEQDHRIPELLGLGGTSGDDLVQPPARAGSPGAGTEASPGGMSPERRLHDLPGHPVSSILSEMECGKSWADVRRWKCEKESWQHKTNTRSRVCPGPRWPPEVPSSCDPTPSLSSLSKQTCDWQNSKHKAAGFHSIGTPLKYTPNTSLYWKWADKQFYAHQTAEKNPHWPHFSLLCSHQYFQLLGL